MHDILSVLILELFLNLGQLRREKENLLKLNTTNLNFLRNRVIQFHVQSGKTYEIKTYLQQQKRQCNYNSNNLKIAWNQPSIYFNCKQFISLSYLTNFMHFS